MPANRFIESLSPSDLALLTPSLRRRTLARDELVAREEAPVERVYLPMNAILSVIAVMRDGRQVETRTIGFEGGYGLLHALGSPMSYERVITQAPGEVYDIALNALAEAARQSASLVTQIVSFAQASLLQSAQTTACNALHDTEQRLCRWLLMTRDRLGSEVLPLTQEHLSIMLGVQRTTVTAIASSLQARGVLAYSRGKIRIADIAAVSAIACECYAAVDQGVELMVGRRHGAWT